MNAFGRVSAVALDREGGGLQAASGPIWAGAAGGL